MLSNFKKNKKIGTGRHFLLSAGAIALLFIFIILIIYDIKIYRKRQEFLAQIASLQNQIKDIENRNNNLKEGIDKSDDSQYIEKVAREELDLQKPGEKAVSFIMPPPIQNNNTSPKNSFQVWWEWLKSKF